MSVAATKEGACIKLKGGEVGYGIGHEEFSEVEPANSGQADSVVRLLSALTGATPYVSRQIRRNYKLGDVELALKSLQAIQESAT